MEIFLFTKTIITWFRNGAERYVYFD